MYPSLKATQRAMVVAAINPQSAGVGTVVSGWVDMAKAQRLLAVIVAGALGASATVDAKLQQATSIGGAGAKDIAGKAITQLQKATPDDNKQSFINVGQADLDVTNGFRFVQLSITVGVAASLVAGLLFEFDPRYGPADLDAAASVKEIIG